MRKRLRRFKKLILSHQVEALIILISIAICILGTIAISFLCIPIIILIDVIFLNFNNIKKLFKKKDALKIENIEVNDDFNTIIETIDESNLNYIEEKIEGEDMKKKVKEKRVKEKKPRKKKKIIKIILIIILACTITGFVGAAGFWFYISKNAPEFSEEKLYKKESSILYDKEGVEFAKLGSEFREKITYDQLPEVLINAIIATEDSRFFEHNGFDLPRFAKASVKQVLKKVLGVGGNAGGASTLTMQISKNAFTSTESEGLDGIIRKFTDIYVSINEIEKKYTKEEIIEFYVNSYCLGGNIYGVEQAAISYFGKSAKELNLSEAAIIAGLFQAPNYYSPVSNPENAEYRRSIVLSLMVRHGYITQEEANIAKSIPVEDLVVENFSYSSNNPYQGFIDTVVSEVKNDTGYNPYSTPMEIYTTLDRKKQDVINDAMNGNTFNWENPVVNAGISVLDSQTGEIVAIGTGRDTSGIGLLNHATFENQTKRQIGSTAKPLYDYATSVEFNNISPAYTIADEPYKYTSGQEIFDWDGKYQDVIGLRDALADSRNVPALKLFQSVKNKDIVKFVTGLGLHPEGDGGSIHEAHAIGGYTGESPVSLSGAYAAFANGGTYNEPHSYTKLIYRDTNKTVEKEFKSEVAMKDSTAFIIYDMLISTAQHAMYTYKYINGFTYGAKTGTTNFTDQTKEANKLAEDAINDLWCVTTTDEYTIAVWYGYDKINSTYYSHFGNMNQLKLINTVSKQIFTRSANIKQPDSVVRVTYENAAAGEPKLPSKYTPDSLIASDYFVKGSEPTEVSTLFTKLDDVKNFQGSYSNGTVTLTWTPVSQWQDKLEETYKFNGKDYTNFPLGWFQYYTANNFFRDKDYAAEFATKEYNIWLGLVGHITYNIYERINDENVLIATTTDSEINIDIDSSAEDKIYIIKTSWEKHDGCESDGSKYTIRLDGETPVLKVALVGSSTETINVGENFDKKILVYSNGTDITSAVSSDIKVTIYDEENNSVSTKLSAIKSLAAGTYTIKYSIKYGANTKSINRTLIIKEES